MTTRMRSGCFSTLVPWSACAASAADVRLQHERQAGADADAVQAAGEEVAARAGTADVHGVLPIILLTLTPADTPACSTRDRATREVTLRASRPAESSSSPASRAGMRPARRDPCPRAAPTGSGARSDRRPSSTVSAPAALVIADEIDRRRAPRDGLRALERHQVALVAAVARVVVLVAVDHHVRLGHHVRRRVAFLGGLGDVHATREPLADGAIGGRQARDRADGSSSRPGRARRGTGCRAAGASTA